MNFILAGLAFETGVLTGSAVSAIPVPGQSESVRDWIADYLIENFGPEYTASELQCGW